MKRRNAISLIAALTPIGLLSCENTTAHSRKKKSKRPISQKLRDSRRYNGVGGPGF